MFNKTRFGFSLLKALKEAGGPKRNGMPVKARRDIRERSFLSLFDTSIWNKSNTPYRTLLYLAGWDRNRVRRRVETHGLEATLEKLAADGVYLDADEVKCRKRLVRRGREIPFSPPDLDFVAGPSVPLGTSGTSGPVTKNPLDMAGFRLQASYKASILEHLSVGNRPLVLYYPAPSAAGIGHMLSFALAGRPPDAWFCHMPEHRSPQFHWSIRLRGLATLARVLGVRLPMPRVAPVNCPEPLLRWLCHNTRSRAFVATFPGSALRLREFAKASGIRLPPITWLLGGEPVTERKRNLLEEEGNRVFPWYGAVDTGRIAMGCLKPADADDMHLLTDRFAAIIRPDSAGRHTSAEGPLLLTSLVPEVHKLLLNTDCGDTAGLYKRSCGCPFETLGLDLHVHHVRSAGKITLEGITLPMDFVQNLVEELLPSACGGTPADYQVTEEEDQNGFTRLVVRVAPALDADEKTVCRIVQESIERASGDAGDMAERLSLSGAVKLRRERPKFSRGGKLLDHDRQRRSIR